MWRRSDGVTVRSTEEIEAIENAGKIPRKEVVRFEYPDEEEIEYEAMPVWFVRLVWVIVCIILLIMALTMRGKA